MEKDIPDSSEKDFSNFLYGSFDTEVVPRSFLQNKISGKAFLKMTETHLAKY